MNYETLNKWRVFPRLALCWLLWVGTDAYLWTKDNLQPDDTQWFGNLVIGAVIMGLFAYMNTGGKPNG
jgi:hypothetical protein